MPQQLQQIGQHLQLFGRLLQDPSTLEQIAEGRVIKDVIIDIRECDK